ncbi:hypothetical protein [Isoptericola dokdonensis]|uniref:Aromatic ring-opening dioxygenase LigA n=1 Tax=Isoptericola dokdonensis DS-3 TaxID=1300344 RepID=A0A168F963_9MICO|nr:hypothetical protein I598_1538 [Isoptericola dokdonensis DS-3]
MSSTVTVRPPRGVRGIGMFSLVVGVILIVAGVVVWIVVSLTLQEEKIVVSDDANMFAGQEVAGPFTAFAQAEVINKHALEASGGATYAELEQDDPVRATVMNASFLRASLFTSVVAFGVCALVIGLGLMFILIGIALRRLAGGSEVSVETPALASGGGLSEAGTAAAPSAPARHSAIAHDPPPTAAAPPAAAPPAAAPPAAAPTADPAPADQPPATPPASSAPAPDAHTEPVDPTRRQDGTDRA